MSEPYLGEIRMFAGNFAPRGYAFCDGQLLAVSQNDALFSLFGTIYGGDGRTTFGLPDLRGRLPIHYGSGPGLSPRNLGLRSGQEDVTLIQSQLPVHNHSPRALNKPGDSGSPESRHWAFNSTQEAVYSSGSPDTNLPPETMNNVGGGQSHTNLMPFLCIHFIVALSGIYPSRT